MKTRRRVFARASRDTSTASQDHHDSIRPLLDTGPHDATTPLPTDRYSTYHSDADLLLLASASLPPQPCKAAHPYPQHLQAIERDLRNAHTPSLNQEMNALFEAIPDEIGPLNAKIVAGAIPRDLKNGALLRNGPNARRWGSKGGWLDGDGMVHACVFSEEPRYSRRWLRTEAFAKEEAVGKELFDGSLVAPFGYKLLGNLAKNLFRAKQPQKDTANTALLALKRGRVLGLMEQCRPCEFKIYQDATIETVKPGSNLDGGLDFWSHPLSGGALTAHLHASASRPHEAVGATYSSSDQPFCRIDVIDLASGRVQEDPRRVERGASMAWRLTPRWRGRRQT